MTEKFANLLNESNLFAGIEDAALSEISAIAREQDFAKDQHVYGTGDDTIDLYILMSGMVRFALSDGAKLLRSGTVIKSRTIFGWAALVPEHPRRIGSATCIDNSTLLAINGDAVLAILRTYPASGMIVMERLCGMISRNFMEQRD